MRNWVALVRRQNGLNGFIFGYYHVSTVFPVLVVTPAYLVGAIPLGILMQAALAFQRVEAAFAFCVTSYAKIAEWKAVMDRVAQFEAAMGTVDVPGPQGADIRIASDAGPGLSVADLVREGRERRADRGGRQSRARAGRAGAGARAVRLGQVEPVPRAGRDLAARGRGRFDCRGTRACSPCRSGRISRSARLRQALAYPTPAEEVDDADVRTALAAAGLGHLADRLDEEAEWNTLLSGGEQQRVGFARALIHRPDLLLLDEAVSTLEDAGSARSLCASDRTTAADDGDLDRPRRGAGRAAPARSWR